MLNLAFRGLCRFGSLWPRHLQRSLQQREGSCPSSITSRSEIPSTRLLKGHNTIETVRVRIGRSLNNTISARAGLTYVVPCPQHSRVPCPQHSRQAKLSFIYKDHVSNKSGTSIAVKDLKSIVEHFLDEHCYSDGREAARGGGDCQEKGRNEGRKGRVGPEAGDSGLWCCTLTPFPLTASQDHLRCHRFALLRSSFHGVRRITRSATTTTRTTVWTTSTTPRAHRRKVGLRPTAETRSLMTAFVLTASDGYRLGKCGQNRPVTCRRSQGSCQRCTIPTSNWTTGGTLDDFHDSDLKIALRFDDRLRLHDHLRRKPRSVK